MNVETDNYGFSTTYKETKDFLAKFNKPISKPKNLRKIHKAYFLLHIFLVPVVIIIIIIVIIIIIITIILVVAVFVVVVFVVVSAVKSSPIT